MADVGDILNDDEFFGDNVDTPKEGIEHHKKQECLKSVIDRGKLGHKWKHERVDKASDETINKKYAEYRQGVLSEKGEKTGKVLGKHVINLYSVSISQWFGIRDVTKLQEDIDNDSIIKDQMANIGCLFVCTFGNFLPPIHIAAHTTNNVDFGDEPENEGYEGEGP